MCSWSITILFNFYSFVWQSAHVVQFKLVYGSGPCCSWYSTKTYEYHEKYHSLISCECVCLHVQIQCGAVISGPKFSKIFTKHTLEYELSFVDPAFNWYSAWVPAKIKVISCYIGPRYNGTPLYVVIYYTIHMYKYCMKINTKDLEHVCSFTTLLNTTRYCIHSRHDRGRA